jgi:hypothetical protein
LTLGAGGLLAFFLEPLLLLRLQHRPPHRVVAVALSVFALELLLCGLVPHPLVVVPAMMLAGPASGVACSFAQAALTGIHRAAGRANAAERAASRWALAAALGDVAAPALLVAVGAGWRSAYLVGAAVAAVLALLVFTSATHARTSATEARNPLVADDADVDDQAGRAGGRGAVDAPAVAAAPAAPFTLRDVLAARAVLVATLAASACTFLDEIVLAIGALWLGDRLALDASARGLVLGGWTVAALLGTAAVAAAVERVPAPRLLIVSGPGCGLAFGAALLVAAPAPAAALLAVAGFFASWHWPLCQALALRAAGPRPLLAGAAAALWQPLELLAPFAVAAAAGTFGSAATMALLLLQPAAVLAAGVAFTRSRRAP